MPLNTPRGVKRHTVPSSLIVEFLEERSGTAHGNCLKGGSVTRTTLAKQYAQRARVSVGTFYRHVRKYEFEQAVLPHRKKRSDAGKSYLDIDTVVQLERISLECADPVSGHRLPMDIAVRKAVKRGILDNEVPASTVHRRTRELGLRRLPAFRRLETLRPNEIHHIDASGSRWFEAVDVVYDSEGNEVDYMIEVRHEPNQRHSKDWKKLGGLNLWIVQLVDDFSRCKYAEYVIGQGESAYLMLGVIERAWRGDPELPFMHMPHAVNMDHGALRRRREMPEFFARLDTEIMPRMPHQSHVGGKVERQFRVEKTRFEQSFADTPGMRLTLSELNHQFRNFLIEENRRTHPIHTTMLRSELYTRIVNDPNVRAVPDNLMTLPFRPETRVVNRNGEISFEGVYYKVDLRLCGKRVLVFKSLDGKLCMTDPLDGEGRFTELIAGMRSTPYYDSRREGDRWAHRYKPRSFDHDTLQELAEKRRHRDGEGWPASEQIWEDPEQKTVVLPVERERPKVFSPHLEAEKQAREFRSVMEAKLWISEYGLGKPLSELSGKSLDELNDLLSATLERAVIAEWCHKVKAKTA